MKRNGKVKLVSLLKNSYKRIRKPGSDFKVFVCGPPGLYKAISGPKVSPTDQGELTGALKDLGFEKNMSLNFRSL